MGLNVTLPTTFQYKDTVHKDTTSIYYRLQHKLAKNCHTNKNAVHSVTANNFFYYFVFCLELFNVEI